jgi:hypothetical protein
VLDLQRLIGNAATQRMLIQRLPTEDTVKQTLGGPKSNFLWKKNSTSYKAILKALGAWRQWVTSTNLSNDSRQIMEQLKSVLRKFDDVIQGCALYDGETDEKGVFFQRLKLQAQNEKSEAIAAFMKAAKKPQLYGGRNIYTNILPLSTAGNLETNEENNVGTVGGGMNTLQKYKGQGNSKGSESFFKQNTQSMETITMEEEKQFTSNFLQNSKNMTQKEQKEEMEKLRVLQNNSDMVEAGGFENHNLRTANKEVASYRLDLLLDAGLIARAQFALRKVGNQSVLGTLQKGAAGKAAGEMSAARDENDRNNLGRDNAFNINDNTTGTLLSRLQLLDTLAMQMDRHKGNFFLEFDQNGNVIGLTGIDNDMSFGTNDDIKSSRKEYPGLCKYVDKEMAKKILALDPDLLKLAMSDLLTGPEMQALMDRLRKLKEDLRTMESGNKLLEPNQWNAVFGEMVGRTSYQGKIAQKANMDEVHRGY